MVTAYFTDQTSTIHSVDTGFAYAVFKLFYSKLYKIYCLNPLYQGRGTYLLSGAAWIVNYNSTII